MPNVGREAQGGDTRSITILEWVDGIAQLLGTGPEGEIEVIAAMTREGDTLILAGLHIEGPGSGSLGIGPLRDFARRLGRQQRVRRVVVFGARRTTGASQGHTPRPMLIEVE